VFLNSCISKEWLLKYFILLLLFPLLTLSSGCKKKQHDGSPRTRKDHVSADKEKPWKNISNVILIIFENTDYEAVMTQPYFEKLTSQGALLKSYYGIVRTSQPNYFAMVAGDTFGAGNENITLDEPHLGDLLEQHGKSWKNYAEGFPGECYQGEKFGDYARKHVPFISFKNVQDNPERCARVVNGKQFYKDVKKKDLPNFSLYIPDQKNDGHNTGVGYADKWLSRFLPPLLADKELLKTTLIILTFDEATVGGANGNRLYTLFLGANVHEGASSEQDYDHYCLLRTIEGIFDLPTLGKHDDRSSPIDDIWVY
jgi:hypothetical protein